MQINPNLFDGTAALTYREKIFARCARCGAEIMRADDEWEGETYFEVVDPVSRDILIVCEDCINEYGRPAPAQDYGW